MWSLLPSYIQNRGLSTGSCSSHISANQQLPASYRTSVKIRILDADRSKARHVISITCRGSLDLETFTSHVESIHDLSDTSRERSSVSHPCLTHEEWAVLAAYSLVAEMSLQAC